MQMMGNECYDVMKKQRERQTVWSRYEEQKITSMAHTENSSIFADGEGEAPHLPNEGSSDGQRIALP